MTSGRSSLRVALYGRRANGRDEMLCMTRLATPSTLDGAIDKLSEGMTMTARAWLVALAIFTAAGCGSDGGETGSATCTGAGCACTGFDCECVAGADCKTECGSTSCSLDCTTDAKCNGSSEGALTLQCIDTSECKGNGGDGSVITCTEQSNCDLKADAGSTAVCRDQATCKFNLGPRATIRCEDESHCDLKCDVDCVATCVETADCKVSCGADSTPGVTCPDGRLVCGTDC